MNVTVTGPTAFSYLTVFPAGESLPLAANLTFVAGQTVPNLVTAKVGATGAVSLYNAVGSVHVVVDLAGWYDSGLLGLVGARYHPLTPSRILDTRFGNGAPAAPLGSGATMNLQVTGRGGVPSLGVSAVVMNVTVTGPSTLSYLTVFPAGDPLPLAANLTFVAGQTVPNLVTAKLSLGGQVSIFNAVGTTHVVADVSGWYDTGLLSLFGATYHPLTPTRILDTRTGTGATAAPLGPSATMNLQVAGRGGVPAAGVTAVAMNVTVTGPSTASYLTVFPAGEALPLAANLNFVGGQTVPNLVTAKLGANGAVSIYNAAGTTHVIADLAGWFDSG
jgi:hypothetical protein